MFRSQWSMFQVVVVVGPYGQVTVAYVSGGDGGGVVPMFRSQWPMFQVVVVVWSLCSGHSGLGGGGVVPMFRSQWPMFQVVVVVWSLCSGHSGLCFRWWSLCFGLYLGPWS